MLFNNHTMSIINDLNILGQEINNIYFLTVAAITDKPVESPNVYYAGSLLPPTELMMRWADGDPYVMQNEYVKYLCNSREADEMIVSLLAALTKKNVVLYIPDEEFNIFGRELLNHLYYTYGLILNTPNTTFEFMIDKTPLIISKFYLMDLMSGEDFISSYPNGCALIPDVVNKLSIELHPFNQPLQFQDRANYFIQLINNNCNKNKVMVRTVKKDDNLQ